MDVSIVIPNLNGRQLLERCLSSLEEQTFSSFEIFVIDNGSADDSVAWLKSRHPVVRVIANERNLGFGAAVNQGIRASRGQLVATLNNDTFVEPDWLSTLVEVAAQHPEMGMFATKMILAHRPDTIDSAGICVDKLGIAWDRLGGTVDGVESSHQVEVFGPCAGAALYRRSMLEEIGLFDEEFFAYLEDVDLAWRAQWAGWRGLYVPRAKVYHAHSATAKEGSLFKNRLKGRNKVWLLCKNYPFPSLLWYLAPILAFDVLAVGYALLINHDAGALQGRLAALRGVPAMLGKRRSLVRRVSSSAMMRRLRPIELPHRVLNRFSHLRA
ncbi:MAG: glycosyltransferase family 2 protein [Anaerolineae bacterium]